MNEWKLEVRFVDSLENALFSSRSEALEFACSIIGDYGASVEVAIFSPAGERELIQRAFLCSQPKAQ